MSDLVKNFHKITGYLFKDEALLTLALTHRSLGKINNERLEFLGDSIVNFIVGEHLFLQFPQAFEGQLSRVRASLVKGETLAELAVEIKLPEILVMGEGESRAGGNHRSSILAGATEAIIGAMYLDGGFEQCQTHVLAWYESRFNELTIDDQCIDAKTMLQEFLQAKKNALPRYEIVDTKGKAHEQIFTIQCAVECSDEVTQGVGASRRKAEQIAANLMFKKLSND
jgi:ribonuclease III